MGPDAYYLFRLASKLPDTRFAPGLAEREFASLEAKFEIVFPPDLRAWLASRLPTGPRWPEWRAALSTKSSDADAQLRSRLNWPLDGMLFDIENNSFWDPAWGEKPDRLEDACAIATGAVRAAPRLIPVYSHRYMPAEPYAAGNPVFSVWQTDIIVYGANLLKYLHAETHGWDGAACEGARDIRCWTRWMLAEWTM